MTQEQTLAALNAATIFIPIGSGVGVFRALAAEAKTIKQLETFFQSSKFSQKVLSQASRGDLHSFPASVETFAIKYGVPTTVKGGDGVVYDAVILKGTYQGKPGTFEWIKNASGEINHRFFRVD